MSGGTHVNPHTPDLGAVSPADVGAVAEAHTAAVQAAATLRDHYHQQVLGQGAQAGDPMPAESTATQQSYPTAGQNPQATVNTKSTL
jgi:hypothetical protein